MNKKEVLLILNRLKISPNKNLGQNFLINKSIAEKIVSLANITKNDVILEIGPGLGALTELLVKKSKFVYAIEIEHGFCSFLRNKFSIYDNVDIINGDILKISIPNHDKVISNVPYSITGPIFEKIFFKKNPPEGIFTIEKSIADRIFSQNKYKKISRITVSVNSFMEPVEKFEISRNAFYPVPNIELSLIRIIPKENINPFLIDMEKRSHFLKFIEGIMPYKNKNLVNALQLCLKNKIKRNLSKKIILEILEKNNFRNQKVFKLGIDDYVKLSKIFFLEKSEYN